MHTWNTTSQAGDSVRIPETARDTVNLVGFLQSSTPASCVTLENWFTLSEL